LAQNPEPYEALTSARVYRRKAMSGDRALGLMRVGEGTAFDPIVLKSFIQMLGVYPIGTILEFDNGQLGLVSQVSLSEDLTRPRVMMLSDEGLGGFRCREEVDLTDKDGEGNYRYRISRSSHPSVRNIQPATLLL